MLGAGHVRSFFCGCSDNDTVTTVAICATGDAMTEASDAPGSSNHRALLTQLQRNLYDRNKQRIAEHEQILTPGFEAYRNNYLAGVSDFESIASFSDLVDEVRDSEITLVGDYHTLRHSQKSFLKILRRLRRKRVVIALEFFPMSGQTSLNRWMANLINDQTLLRRCDIAGRWPWNIWPCFKPILELARARGWRVIGLDGPREKQSSLEERDRRMADVLVQEYAGLGRNGRIVTLVGELHVARDHLPAAIAEGLPGDRSPRVLSVFQNTESIYWRLVDRHLEQDTEVVRIDENRFCVLTAPPLVVQQSYLNWIEYDEDTLDHEDLARHFRRIASLIDRSMRLRMQGVIKHVGVHGPGELDVDDWDPTSMNPEACWIHTGKRRVYLGNLNLNEVAEVATRLLHCIRLGVEEEELQTFYSRVIHEAFAFLGSKIINSRRKGHHESHFRKILREVKAPNAPDTLTLEIAAAVLLHKSFEQGKRTRGFPRIVEPDARHREGVIRALGVMLGERLYYAFIRDHITAAEIRLLFNFPAIQAEQSAALYFSLIRQVGRERIPKRI